MGTEKPSRRHCGHPEWARHYEDVFPIDVLFKILCPDHRNRVISRDEFVTACANIHNNRAIRLLPPQVRYAAHLAAMEVLNARAIIELSDS